VLNERETGVRISEETRQRILTVAQEMGYRRNALARVVATGRNPVLAFMAPFASDTWARYLVGMSEAAEAEGHFVKIVMGRYVNRYSAVQPEAINSCVELRLSGVVAHTLNEVALENLRQALLPYRIPVAVLGNPLPLPWGVSVHADYEQGCRLSVGHLHELGHRRIAMIGGSREQGVGKVFEDAFEGAMREHGLSLPSQIGASATGSQTRLRPRCAPCSWIEARRLPQRSAASTMRWRWWPCAPRALWA
jgi:LacI family transcriptional regulator